MTTPQKHQKLYDWLVEQPVGCESHHAAALNSNNKFAIEALKELTAMIMSSSNHDISNFIENARAGIREKTSAACHAGHADEPDFLCTD